MKILTFCVLYLLLFSFISFEKKVETLVLTKDFQHTVGELPIVEMFDDGDVYEFDGQENWNSQNCNSNLSNSCDKRYNNTYNSTKCYLNNIYYCKNLQKQSIKSACYEGIIGQCDYFFSLTKKQKRQFFKMFHKDGIKKFKNKDQCYKKAKEVCITQNCDMMADFGVFLTCWSNPISFK